MGLKNQALACVLQGLHYVVHKLVHESREQLRLPGSVGAKAHGQPDIFNSWHTRGHDDQAQQLHLLRSLLVVAGGSSGLAETVPHQRAGLCCSRRAGALAHVMFIVPVSLSGSSG